MASKKKKVAKADESAPVVPVVFNHNTSYGKSGTFGYIPGAFAEAWIKKGVVTSAVQYMKDHEEEEVAELIPETVEADDEVDTKGKPADVEPAEDDSLPRADSAGDGSGD